MDDTTHIVLGTFVVGLLVSQDDPALDLGDSTAASSPFGEYPIF